MPIDFDKALNEEQLAAVKAGDGPVLVIAAAGTGKTRTLVYRVAWLIEKGIAPDEILLVTFTNKAAREMMDRGRELAGPTVGGMWGGTFHHLGNRMLRRHAELLGYRNDYGILDSDDAQSLMRTVIQDLGLKDKKFPKAEVLLGLYSYARNTAGSIQEIVQDHFLEHPVPEEDVLRVFPEYESRKVAMQSMDFDDLLTHSVKLLREHEGVRNHYQQRFRHIMVDEYQDTNVIQAAFIDLLAAHHKNLLVVGDDFQSIYGWRGADFRNIIAFPQRYAGAQVFKLQTNYRSVPQILAVANRCIQGNPEQFQKELRAVRPDGESPPLAVQTRTGDDQARFVVERIQQLRREGYRHDEFAILYRSHFHSMEVQLELTRARIPYLITSGVRFFEQAHIKDVCALPKLIHNPNDQLAFMRLLGMIPRVGERTVSKLWTSLGARFSPLDATHRAKLMSLLPPAARPHWENIDAVMKRCADEQTHTAPGRVIAEFVDAWYDEYAVTSFENAPRRIEDIQELIAYSGRFSSLDEFMSEMALLSSLEASEDMDPASRSDAVRLSSIHQAKGLEWPVVFVLWLAEGMFPSSRAIDEGDESEERRLFYVVTTRAKDQLFLCTPQMRRGRDGSVQFYTSSRFVNELGAPLVRKQQFSSGGGHY